MYVYSFADASGQTIDDAKKMLEKFGITNTWAALQVRRKYRLLYFQG